MRISDWSSDVCSSDLIQCRRFGGCRQERGDDIAAFPHGRVIAQRVVQPAPQQPAAHGRLAMIQGREKRGAFLARQCFGRSEEHTSELQSLMRISYAVFCLKKKKKITYILLTYMNNHNT